MKPALLVIDVQKEFFKTNPETARSLNSAIEYINAAIALFREKGLPESLNIKDSDLHIIIRNALASGSQENIRFVENVNDVISYGSLKAVPYRLT